jgi:DNA replication and repair protein RecF
MLLTSLHLDNFRNYKDLTVKIPEKGMLLTGPNGSGKTNLLEAVFMLCTARSQRGATRNELIAFSSDYSYVEGGFSLVGKQPHLTVSIGFTREQKVSMKKNGTPVSSFSQWLGHGMAVSFGPEDLALVQGVPKDRRNFLDIFLSQIDSSYLSSLMSYRKNLAQRNNLLARQIGDAQLDVYEEAMAMHGASVFFRRREICNAMAPVFASFYGEIGGTGECASLDYRPSVKCESGSREEWKTLFYRSLKNAKIKDMLSGHTSVGPHRDDIALLVNGKDARSFASQGQCTTVALSLRLASVFVGEQYKKDEMIFLFDDAVSYLDAARTSRVFPLLENRGQLLVTAPSDRDNRAFGLPRYVVREGAVAPQ